MPRNGIPAILYQRTLFHEGIFVPKAEEEGQHMRPISLRSTLAMKHFLFVLFFLETLGNL